MDRSDKKLYTLPVTGQGMRPAWHMSAKEHGHADIPAAQADRGISRATPDLDNLDRSEHRATSDGLIFRPTAARRWRHWFRLGLPCRFAQANEHRLDLDRHLSGDRWYRGTLAASPGTGRPRRYTLAARLGAGVSSATRARR